MGNRRPTPRALCRSALPHLHPRARVCAPACPPPAQKLARDRVGQARKEGAPGSSVGCPEERQLCQDLNKALQAGGLKAWDDSWEAVYRLAELVVERLLSSPPEGEAARSRL